MGLALAICGAVWIAAATGCSPIIHLVLRNDTGRIVKALTWSGPTTVAPGASGDVTPASGGRLQFPVEMEQWNYGRSWGSSEFS